MNNPKLYTVKEAAKIIGVSTNTLYKYLDEDRIHAARGSAQQGRFRIPQSALEDFLGIKLSEPAPLGSDLTGSAQPRDIPSGEGQTLQDIDQTIDHRPSTINHKLPLKIARFLLILALISILADLFISRTVSLPAQLTRLLFLGVMLLLAYQEGGYRRG